MDDPHALDQLVFLTPPQTGKLLGVSSATVIGWIRAGELRAVDLARRGASRPRYRISREELDRFLAGRAVQTRTRPARRRRRDQRVIQFF